MRVARYFKLEFSDSSLRECVFKLAQAGDKNVEYWVSKVKQVMDFHEATNKSPGDAAGFIARIIRPRLKKLVRDAQT